MSHKRNDIVQETRKEIEEEKFEPFTVQVTIQHDWSDVKENQQGFNGIPPMIIKSKFCHTMADVHSTLADAYDHIQESVNNTPKI